MSTITLGKKGEDLAEKFLRRNRYKILERNFRVKLGEIDIIAKEKDTICFVEVKTRRTEAKGTALESVSGPKQRKLAQVALCYLKKKKWEDKKTRFDVIAVGDIEKGLKGIEIIKDAFALNGEFSI